MKVEECDGHGSENKAYNEYMTELMESFVKVYGDYFTAFVYLDGAGNPQCEKVKPVCNFYGCGLPISDTLLEELVKRKPDGAAILSNLRSSYDELKKTFSSDVTYYTGTNRGSFEDHEKACKSLAVARYNEGERNDGNEEQTIISGLLVVHVANQGADVIMCECGESISLGRLFPDNTTGIDKVTGMLIVICHKFAKSFACSGKCDILEDKRCSECKYFTEKEKKECFESCMFSIKGISKISAEEKCFMPKYLWKIHVNTRKKASATEILCTGCRREKEPKVCCKTCGAKDVVLCYSCKSDFKLCPFCAKEWTQYQKE